MNLLAVAKNKRLTLCVTVQIINAHCKSRYHETRRYKVAKMSRQVGLSGRAVGDRMGPSIICRWNLWSYEDASETRSYRFRLAFVGNHVSTRLENHCKSGTLGSQASVLVPRDITAACIPVPREENATYFEGDEMWLKARKKVGAGTRWTFLVNLWMGQWWKKTGDRIKTRLFIKPWAQKWCLFHAMKADLW